MNQKPDLSPEQREIVDRFIVDLPKILAGADPFKWAPMPLPTWQDGVCSVEGCEDHMHTGGMCRRHYMKTWNEGRTLT